MHSVIDGEFLELMLGNGFCNLYANKEFVNDLNVFPVPDGDTGINMTMTMQGGVENHTSTKHIGEFMQSFAKNTLFSARGNSGVILSQFIRGFADGLADVGDMQISDFVSAMQSGVAQAYESVVKPVEGTMLTVMREASEFLITNNKFDTFEDLFIELIPKMQISLENTPSLLPVLAEAGVVDSGGAGFLKIFEGMKMAFDGRILDKQTATAQKSVSMSQNSTMLCDNGKLEFGYCTEFILQLMFADNRADNFSLDEMIAKFEELGDSIVAIRDNNIVKVHVHSYNPEQVLAYAHRFGEFLTMKIENMALQHNEIVHKNKKQHKKYVVVAVASGDGIASYFSGIGADVIINGGQTVNPSAEDFIKAFDSVSADYIVVLPNNSNVVMTAKQAAQIYDSCDVRVIETKSIAEGFSSLSMMNGSSETIDDLIEGMVYGLPNVSSCFLTTASRDSSLNGLEVKKGSFIGLDRDTLLSTGNDRDEVVLEMLRNLPEIDDKGVITAFYGNGVTGEDAETLKEKIEDEFPLIECGFIEGKQPVYDYIFAVE